MIQKRKLGTFHLYALVGLAIIAIPLLFFGLFVLRQKPSQAYSTNEIPIVDQKYVKKLPINLTGFLMGFAGDNLFFYNPAEKGGIMVYDISKNNKKLISLDSSGPSNIGKWAFTENYIAFFRQDSNAYQDQIVVKDFKTDKEKIIYARNMSDNFMPASIAAWGNLVVWNDRCVIYLYDLQKDSKKVVVDKSSHEGCKYGINYPAPETVNDFIGFDLFHMYKDNITWTELTGKYGLGQKGVLYNLSINHEETVPGIGAVIWGDYLIYLRRDSNTKKMNLYYYNIKTEAETKIPNQSESPTRPNIFGNNVVYSEHLVSETHYNDYLYIYNYQDRILRRITPNPSLRPLQYSGGYIWGNNVVWMDYRSGKPEIYLYEIHQEEVQPTTAKIVESPMPSVVPSAQVVIESPKPSPVAQNYQNDNNFINKIYSFFQSLFR